MHLCEWTLSVCPNKSQHDGKEAIITEGHTQFTCSMHTPALLTCGVYTHFTAIALQSWQFNRVLNWRCPPHSPLNQLLNLHCGHLRLVLHHVRRSKGRQACVDHKTHEMGILQYRLKICSQLIVCSVRVVCACTFSLC